MIFSFLFLICTFVLAACIFKAFIVLSKVAQNLIAIVLALMFTYNVWYLLFYFGWPQ